MSHKRSHEEYQKDHIRAGESSKSSKQARASSNPNGRENTSSAPKGDNISTLDQKYPAQTRYTSLPSYDSSVSLAEFILDRTKPDGIPQAKSKESWYVGGPPLPSTLPELPVITDPELAEAPFRHSSKMDSKYGPDNNLHYERLEFLGDAYIDLIATRIIFARFPQLLTGKQSSLREKLVKNRTLAAFSRAYGFDGRVDTDNDLRDSMPPKSQSTDSKKQKMADKRFEAKLLTWEKIHADVFEAYVAALILSFQPPNSAESGFEIAERWLTQLWVPILLEDDYNLQPVVNRKDELARRIGGRDVVIKYEEFKPMEMTEDKGTQQNFMQVVLSGWGHKGTILGRGVGVGKKEAGMRAAIDALDNNSELIDKISTKKRIFNQSLSAKRAK